MKLNRLTEGLRAVLNKFKGGVSKQSKKSWSNGPLTSRFVRVRFGAHANAAEARRRTRDQVLKGVRRNSYGMPPEFSRWTSIRRYVIRAFGTVLRYDRDERAWKREPHSKAQQGEALREALKVGRELRRGKMSKLARRVMGRRRRSCSATRAMLDIMERRDMLGRGTDRLAIKEPAAYRAHTPTVTLKEKLFQQAFASVTSQHPHLSRRDRRAAARKVASLARLQTRGLQPAY